MKRVSIMDVAREVGVSKATVSYVLNHHPGETISADTTARVWDAVKRLNYVPNLNARSLISRKTNMIGVIIPQTEPGKEFMFANPFYGELLSAIEYTARKSGYHLLLTGTETDQSYINIARNRGVDGIIVVGTYPSKNLAELRSIDVPVVLIDSYVRDPAFHTIGIDDKEGGRLATSYLIEHGHRKIAFVSGSLREHGVNDKRYSGYLAALAQAGIAFNEKRVYAGTVDFDYGICAAKEMAERGQKETAAFIAADVLAMGLVKGLHGLGVRIPQDLSIVSFDDVYLSQMCEPSLTTIRQDISAKGRNAVQVIIDAAAQTEHKKREIIMPITLVERESVEDRRE
ncbi:MAG: LacI family transcriptional regulator [Oscillospiraceae bacterium]|jgi:LacI family transcriptional regulator|nr:LacI family transcriptional regulator [Oscillospiraceae bacterium]